MKKVLLIYVLGLFVGVSTCFAQLEMRPRPFEMGLNAGLAFSWLNSKTDGFENKGISISGLYGLNMDINLCRAVANYYFHTGVNIYHVKTRLEYIDDYRSSDTLFKNQPVKSTYKTMYLSVPTALKLQTNSIHGFIVYGIFGLDNSVCISSKKEDEVGKQGTFKTLNNKGNTATFREALLVAAGAEYIIRDNTRISVGLTYNNGFTNMFKDKYCSLSTGEEISVCSRLLEFRIGLIF